ncbi:MAG TPA: hypothetical protein VNM87_04460, partial [Candidatus Udaeobacter sp.]|nr:hypothetical protein [Candidatus Udaeobacter sp.]
MTAAEPRDAVDLITTALDQIVTAIEAAGIAATRDPGDFQPPAAIVGPPTITGAATMQSIGLTVPVYIVTPDPGQPGLDWMLAQVATLLPVFGETAAEPTLWTSPLAGPGGLPAYVITVRANVSTTYTERIYDAIHR